eukprot:TCONS_00031723-protein
MASGQAGRSRSTYYRKRELFLTDTNEVFHDCIDVTDVDDDVYVYPVQDHPNDFELQSDVEMVEESSTSVEEEMYDNDDASNLPDFGDVFESYVTSHYDNTNVEDLVEVFKLQEEFASAPEFLDENDDTDSVYFDCDKFGEITIFKYIVIISKVV